MTRLLFVAILSVPLAAQTSFATTRHAFLPPLPFAAAFDRGDLDGDGDLDLVVAGDFFAVRLLDNDGNGLFVDASAGRLPANLFYDNTVIDLADIDGDADLDLLIANEDGLSNFVFTNNGAGVFTDATATALPANAFDTKDQVVADFDGDGDVDWLTLDGSACHYYVNNGMGVFTDLSVLRLVGVPGLGIEGMPTPSAVDLDGDGDLDVLAPGLNGMLRNQGGALTPFAIQLPVLATMPHWLADVDGDGDVDLFANGGDRLFLNLGNAQFVSAPAATFPSQLNVSYGSFDVDRDGDVDVFAASGLLLNDGSGNFSFAASSQPAPLGLLLGRQLAEVADDYDGDGDLELPGLPNFLHHVVAPTAPTLGSSYSVDLYTRPGVSTLGVVFGALGPGQISLGTFGSLRLDPASIAIISVQLLTPGPTSVTLAVPNVPALVGAALHFQAIVDDPQVGVLSTNTFRDFIQ